MDREALETEKLKAELAELQAKLGSNRGSLEVEKLKLDIGQARLNRRLEFFKVVPTYLAIAMSLVVATASYVQSRNQMVEQQQRFLDQKEREDRFKVTQELVALVREINASSPELQRNAALELGLYGVAAAPILIENLDVVRDRSVSEAIARAVQATVKSEKDGAVVANHLLRASEAVFTRELAKTDSAADVAVILAHVRALGDVGSLALQSKPTRARVALVLNELPARLRRATAALGPLDPSQRNRLFAAVATQQGRVKSE